jgi:hypothetical protein
MTATVIAVFAFRRPRHLAQVLDSLLQQTQGCTLPVHLFLDGPRSLADRSAVEATRQVAAHYQDRLLLTLHASAVNRGLYDSLTQGISCVLADHEQVIVLEDDVVLSSYFLDYMQAALACYATVPAVASIHAYLPPIPQALPDTFFLRGADCWGWATWRNRWSLYRHDAGAMAAELRSRGLARAFDLGGRVPNLRLLDERAAGRSRSWAICWHASCFLADRYTLHPGRSLVRNIGLDHSGEHCVPSASLQALLTDTPLHVLRQKVEEAPAIVAAFARQLAPAPLPLRVLKRLRRIF